MSDLGHHLRRARERAGLSLGSLSARTKIRERLLDAIEHDDFGQLPPGLLARGYLRAYAREVGLEPESIVQRYRSEFDPQTPQEHSARRQTAGMLHTIAGNRGHLWLTAVLVGTTAVFYYANARSKAIGDSGPEPIKAATISGLEHAAPRSIPGGNSPADRGPFAAGVAAAPTIRVSPLTVNGVRGRAFGATAEVRQVRNTRSSRADFQQ